MVCDNASQNWGPTNRYDRLLSTPWLANLANISQFFIGSMSVPSFLNQNGHTTASMAAIWSYSEETQEKKDYIWDGLEWNESSGNVQHALYIVLYCWWKKSCTSWYGKYAIIYRVLYIPGGCWGFLPSTVWLDIQKTSSITFNSLAELPARILLGPIHSDGQKAPIVTQTLESVEKKTSWWSDSSNEKYLNVPMKKNGKNGHDLHNLKAFKTTLWRNLNRKEDL